MERIQPLGDRILVKLLPREEKTSGGLILANSSKNSSNKGEVVAVGEGTTLQDGTIKPLSLKAGDIVLFNVGVGMDIKAHEDEFKILAIRDVLCKVIGE